ncbi:Uncharacterized protein dnl_27010 [Desulfonema limicola]|uniref:Uncharacterized protein n=1 Tax=Desulfonema limicola TaxID=45656 RepID=A0A975GGM2_9BACT|nr:hypothetical protein [Desulfonema limicola]QTA80398.1 Uncharacterized protein dnl_27010 [Desulfonema limicola]
MKSFKKTVSLAMAIIFAFAPMVSAADICTTCKSPINELIYTQEQGGNQRIDYEREGIDPATGLPVRPGYNSRSNTFNSKIIYNICDCPNTVTNFALNRIVGIQLTIMTDGVYWTNEPIAIQPFNSAAAICATGLNNAPNVNYETIADPDDYKLGDVVPNANGNKGTVYLPKTWIVDNNLIASPGYDNHVSVTAADPAATTLAEQGTNNSQLDGIINYLSSLSKYQVSATNANYVGGWDNLASPNIIGINNPALHVATAGRRTTELVDYEYFLPDGTTEVNLNDVIAPGDPVTATIPASKKVKTIRVKNAYQIGVLDSQFSLSRWWVDLPEMRKDISEVKPMSELNVKIELLSDLAGGVCLDCKSICECTETLGVFGADKFTMYFPYVLTQSSPWTSGIAITNLNTAFTAIDNMEAEFTLTDSKGKEFTYVKKDFNAAVWTTMLDGFLGSFTGGTPEPGAAWLKVEANFPVDGYEFMSDGVFGAGTQPRIYDINRMAGENVYRRD